MLIHYRYVLALVCLLSSGYVQADTEQPSLSIAVFNRLVAVERLMAQEQYAKATNKLNSMLEKPPNRPIDRAYVYQSAGNLALIRQDYDAARTYFQHCDAQQVLPESAAVAVLYTLANLALQAEDHQAAITYLNRYMQQATAENIKVQAYLALGTAYFQQQAYTSSVHWLEQAKRQFAPDKNVWSLLFASFYEQGDHPQALRTMEEMVKQWPGESTYWIQLATLYLEQGKVSDSLQMLELAWQYDPEWDQQRVLQFVHTLYDYGIPAKAAIILERAMDGHGISKNYQNLSLLAALYSDAREVDKATHVLLISSALSDNGRDHLYLAQLFSDQDKQDKALEHARKALDKGLSHPGQAHLLMASIFHDRRNRKRLKQALLEASKDQQTASSARSWLANIE